MTVNRQRDLSAFPLAAAIIIGAFLLHGCGGGTNAPQSYTIGGSVSGLTGTVVLQDNGGDNLTLTGNGPFTFATGITTGGDYKVSILSQPLGPTCAVTNGSGTAASNVTTVSVQCTLDPATFLLPLEATPVVPASTGKPGINGLIVLTSKALGDPPVQITGDNVLGLGYAQQLTVSSTGSISPGTITAIAYATSGVAGGDSFWTLNLSGSSSLTPVQMTNFVGAAQSYLSGTGLLAYKNVADPRNQSNPLSPPAGPLAPTSGAANFGQGSSPDRGGFSGSPTIGIINLSAATSTFIAAFDLSKNLITPITMDNTTLNELQPDLAVD